MCPVEQRGIEILFRRRSFAAGNHPEAAEIAQMDRFSVGQRFIHDGQEPVKHQQDITAAGSAVFADTAANTVQVDLFGDAGLCIVKFGPFGRILTHVFSFDKSEF